MPPLPELGYVLADERIVEVFVEVKAENAPQSDSHIGITRKVKQNVQRIAGYTEPTAEYGKRFHISAQCIFHYRVKIVCQNDLFAEPHDKAGNALTYVLGGGASVVYLLFNNAVSYDRTCHQLREQGYEHKEFHRIMLYLDFSPVSVKDIREYLKGVEADTDRQRYMGSGNIYWQYSVQIFHHKVGVFEHAQQTKAHDKRYCNAHLRQLCPSVILYHKTAAVVDYSAVNKQDYPQRLAPGVEYQGKNYKHSIFPAYRLADKIHQQAKRQKRVQKKQIGKDHSLSPFTGNSKSPSIYKTYITRKKSQKLLYYKIILNATPALTIPK